MKSKGFTLIELLSVIIIIAVITLIAVPIVSGVVTKVKLNALKSSANGLLEASDLYYARYNNTKSLRFDIDNNIVSSNDTNNLLSYKGKIKEGTVIINKKGDVTLCITDGTNSVYKNYRDKKIIEAANKKCNIPSSTYIVYLDNTATLNEYSNEELTNIVNELKDEVNTLKQNLDTVSSVASSATLDKIYPVGSIYMSTVDDTVTKVQSKFGGTWERIENKFLLGAGSSYAINTTGGSAINSHTHSVTASGTVNGHTLTISEMPSHSHGLSIWSNTGGSTLQYAPTTGNMTVQMRTSSEGGGASHNHTFTGTAVMSGIPTDTNNMPPYVTVYIYKRTA